VVTRWGVTPAQIPDLLIMMGDKSDNIPGIPGLGVKTAQLILKQFGTLEEALVWASTDTPGGFPTKWRRLLLEHQDKIPQLRQLIEFERKWVPVSTSLPNFKLVKQVMHSLQMTKTVSLVEQYQLAHMKKAASTER